MGRTEQLPVGAGEGKAKRQGRTTLLQGWNTQCLCQLRAKQCSSDKAGGAGGVQVGQDNIKLEPSGGT